MLYVFHDVLRTRVLLNVILQIRACGKTLLIDTIIDNHATTLALFYNKLEALEADLTSATNQWNQVIEEAQEVEAEEGRQPIGFVDAVGNPDDSKGEEVLDDEDEE